MAVFNKPDVYILPVMSQAQGVEISANQYEQISIRTGPSPSQMCRQQILQSNQQQLAYSWVPNESLNRPTMAPCSTFTTARISQYPGNQYNKDNPQGSQRERISELMNNIFLMMMYRKSRSIALDLKTLYRDAFATLNPTTLSMVMGAWKDHIDNTQPANYHGNDAGEVLLDILLKDFGKSQPVFLRQLSHALRCIEIDEFDERVLKWSIAVRKLEFLGIEGPSEKSSKSTIDLRRPAHGLLTSPSRKNEMSFIHYVKDTSLQTIINTIGSKPDVKNPFHPCAKMKWKPSPGIPLLSLKYEYIPNLRTNKGLETRALKLESTGQRVLEINHFTLGILYLDEKDIKHI